MRPLCELSANLSEIQICPDYENTSEELAEAESEVVVLNRDERVVDEVHLNEQGLQIFMTMTIQRRRATPPQTERGFLRVSVTRVAIAKMSEKREKNMMSFSLIEGLLT